jgi:hypothetical protein
MENNTTSKVAEDVLRDLASDRGPLTARLAAPWWVHPLVALLVAGYVATPAISPGAVHNVVVGILAGAFVMLVAGYRWCTGVRLNRVGVRGGAVLAGLVVTVLLLLSASKRTDRVTERLVGDRACGAVFRRGARREPMVRAALAGGPAPWPLSQRSTRPSTLRCGFASAGCCDTFRRSTSRFCVTPSASVTRVCPSI